MPWIYDPDSKQYVFVEDQLAGNRFGGSQNTFSPTSDFGLPVTVADFNKYGQEPYEGADVLQGYNQIDKYVNAYSDPMLRYILSVATGQDLFDFGQLAGVDPYGVNGTATGGGAGGAGAGRAVFPNASGVPGTGAIGPPPATPNLNAVYDMTPGGTEVVFGHMRDAINAGATPSQVIAGQIADNPDLSDEEIGRLQFTANAMGDEKAALDRYNAQVQVPQPTQMQQLFSKSGMPNPLELYGPGNMPADINVGPANAIFQARRDALGNALLNANRALEREKNPYSPLGITEQILQDFGGVPRGTFEPRNYPGQPGTPGTPGAITGVYGTVPTGSMEGVYGTVPTGNRETLGAYGTEFGGTTRFQPNRTPQESITAQLTRLLGGPRGVGAPTLEPRVGPIGSELGGTSRFLPDRDATDSRTLFGRDVPRPAPGSADLNRVTSPIPSTGVDRVDSYGELLNVPREPGGYARILADRLRAKEEGGLPEPFRITDFSRTPQFQERLDQAGVGDRGPQGDARTFFDRAFSGVGRMKPRPPRPAPSGGMLRLRATKKLQEQNEREAAEMQRVFAMQLAERGRTPARDQFDRFNEALRSMGIGIRG